jgi:hypothetical protein
VGHREALFRSAFTFATVLLLVSATLVFPTRTASADSTVGDGTPGSCTRAALANALLQGGLITFNCGPNPVTVPAFFLPVETDAAIDGGGLVTLDANGNGTLLTVENGVSLTIRNLTLTGSTTRAVRVLGGASFTAEKSRFVGSDDHASSNGFAVYTNPSGATTIHESVVSGYRSAVYGEGSTSSIAISGSTLSGNAGAVVGFGTVDIVDTRIESNSGFGSSGSFTNAAVSVTANGRLTMSDSIVRDNDSSWAVYVGSNIQSLSSSILHSAIINNSGGAVTAHWIDLTNSTVAGNGGTGVSPQTTFAERVRLRNVTVAENNVGISGRLSASNTILATNRVRDCSGTLTSLGYNLIESTNGCTIVGDVTGNVLGEEAVLAPPSDSGPFMPSYEPLPESPALDAGNPAPSSSDSATCAEVDQLHTPRPVGDACDIGAIESDQIGLPTTQVYLSSESGPGGWYNQPVDVTLIATADSGIQGITWSATGAMEVDETVTPNASVTIPVAANGTTVISFHATDRDGSIESTQSITLSLDTVTPSTSAPDFTLAFNISEPTNGIRGVLKWTGADTDSGVARFEVQYASPTVTNGQFVDLALVSPQATVYRGVFPAGTTYEFRVRAVDAAGNISPWATTETIALRAYQESNARTIYTYAWPEVLVTGAQGGRVRFASSTGASATITFQGTSIGWLTTRGPNRGRARVFLDGVQLGVVDLYSPTLNVRRLQIGANDLDPNATHTLEVRSLGTKNAASMGSRVDIDAFIVID